jgi:putative DNA primase/helicase
VLAWSTGKTYLIELIDVIAMSHKPVPTAGAEKKEEFEKRVETAALSGRPIIHLNNLPNGMTVESERLCEYSTEGMVSIRLLGHHQEGQCDCRATTIFLNGNNIVMGGDLVFRTVGCRLDAEEEHPEERTFNFDPMQEVRKDRGAYLAAVFTIIRAFFAAGTPKPANMKRVAGFDQWSQWIQQPLMWLGMPDPFGSMEKMRGRVPTEEKLLQVLEVLQQVFKTDDERRAITVAECAKRAEQCPALREWMLVRGEINTRSFGRLLTGYDGKIRGGWRIRVSDEPGKSNLYILECVNPKPATAEAASAAVDDFST